MLFTDPAIRALRRHAWPGNVRELESVVTRLVAFSRDGRITRADVAGVLSEPPPGVAALRAAEDLRQRKELTSLLRETGGTFAAVARRLGLRRGAVIYRAQKFGLLARQRGRV